MKLQVIYVFFCLERNTYYICDMQTTLFPDYFALDETCCLHRAEIVMEKLAEIPLIFLDNQQERNTVL